MAAYPGSHVRVKRNAWRLYTSAHEVPLDNRVTPVLVLISCSLGIGVTWACMKGVGNREVKPYRGESQARRKGPFSILYLPHPANCLIHTYQTVKRNLLQCSSGVREVSRHLSIILAGNFQLSWPGSAYWNPSSNAMEKVQFPPALLLITKKNDGLIIFQQEREIYFIWKFGN